MLKKSLVSLFAIAFTLSSCGTSEDEPKDSIEKEYIKVLSDFEINIRRNAGLPASLHGPSLFNYWLYETGRDKSTMPLSSSYSTSDAEVKSIAVVTIKFDPNNAQNVLPPELFVFERGIHIGSALYYDGAYFQEWYSRDLNGRLQIASQSKINSNEVGESWKFIYSSTDGNNYRMQAMNYNETVSAVSIAQGLKFSVSRNLNNVPDDLLEIYYSSGLPIKAVTAISLPASKSKQVETWEYGLGKLTKYRLGFYRERDSAIDWRFEDDYEYDDSGRALSMKRLNSKNGNIDFTQEVIQWDKIGNWTRLIYKEEGKNIMEIARIITYKVNSR